MAKKKLPKKCNSCRYHTLAKETTGSDCGYRYPEFYDVEKDGCPLYQEDRGQDKELIEKYKKAICEV